MAKTSAIRKGETEGREPANIGDRASTISNSFAKRWSVRRILLAVPGYGGILMGATAVAAAYIAISSQAPANWLAVWLTEACLAFRDRAFGDVAKIKACQYLAFFGSGQKFALRFCRRLSVVWC